MRKIYGNHRAALKALFTSKYPQDKAAGFAVGGRAQRESASARFDRIAISRGFSGKTCAV